MMRCLISVARLLRLLKLLLCLKLKLLLRQVLSCKRVRCLVSHAFQFALVLDDNDWVLILDLALLCAFYVATLGEKVWLLGMDGVRHAFNIVSSHSIDEASLASAIGCHDLRLLRNNRHHVFLLLNFVRDLLTLFFRCLVCRWLAQLILALPVHEGLEEGEVERVVLDDFGDLLFIFLLTVFCLGLRSIIVIIFVLMLSHILFIVKVALIAMELAQRVLLLNILAHVDHAAPCLALLIVVRVLRGEVFLRVGPLAAARHVR